MKGTRGFAVGRNGRNVRATCRSCGAACWTSYGGDSGVQLCKRCYNESQAENNHGDNGHVGPLDSCPLCADILTGGAE